MKNITTLIAICAIAGFAFVGCNSSDDTSSDTATTSAPEATMEEKTVSLKVTGMT